MPRSKKDEPTEAERELRKAQREVLERLFLTALAQCGPDLPTPEPQKTGLIPGRDFAVDFYWRDPLPLCVEIDGGRWQVGGGKHGTPEDVEKVNLLALYRFMVFRFTGDMLKHDPDSCISIIRAYFRNRVSEFRKGKWPKRSRKSKWTTNGGAGKAD